MRHRSKSRDRPDSYKKSDYASEQWAEQRDGLVFEDLFGGRTGSAPQFSPSGKQISYIDSGNLWIYELSQNEGAPRIWQLTEGTPLGTGTEYGGVTYCWSASGRFIFFVSSGQLWRVSLDGEVARIAQHVGTSCNFHSPAVSPDGARIAFCIEDRDRTSIGFIDEPERMDTQSLKNLFPTRIATAETVADFCYDLVFNPQDKNILAFHGWKKPHMSWTKSNIYFYNFMNDSVSTLILTSDDYAVCQPKWSPSGQTFTFLSDQKERHNIWSVDANKNNFKHLHKSHEVFISGVWLSGNSSYVWINETLLAFVTVSFGFCTLWSLDISGDVPIATQRSQRDGAFSHLSVSSDGRYLTCYYNDYKTRGEILLFKLAEVATSHSRVLLSTGARTPPTAKSPRGNREKEGVVFCGWKETTLLSSGVKMSPQTSDKFIKPVHVIYPVGKKGTGYGMILRPKVVKKNYPALVAVHGGPNGYVFNNWGTYMCWMQYWCSRGYVCFAPNYRGSWGYGRDYRMELNRNWGVYDTQDIFAASEYLVKNEKANKSQLAVLGLSSGGYSVYNQLVFHPNHWAAGISLNGVSNLFWLNEDTHAMETHYNVQLIGPLPATRTEHVQRSPSYFANKISDPLLILQGSDDTVVPKKHSDSVYKKCKPSITEYHEYPGERHILKKNETLRDFYERVDRFLIEHVETRGQGGAMQTASGNGHLERLDEDNIM